MYLGVLLIGWRGGILGGRGVGGVSESKIVRRQ